MHTVLKCSDHLLASHLLQHVLLHNQDGIKQLLPFSMVGRVFCYPALSLLFLLFSQLEGGREGEGRGGGEGEGEGERKGEGRGGEEKKFSRD